MAGFIDAIGQDTGVNQGLAALAKQAAAENMKAAILGKQQKEAAVAQAMKQSNTSLNLPKISMSLVGSIGGNNNTTAATIPVVEQGLADKAAAPVVGSTGLLSKVTDAANPILKKYGLNIISGYRDPEQNKAAGGAKNSQHMHGTAIDINWRDMPTETRVAVMNELHNAGFKGFGVGPGSLHVDMREAPASWSYYGASDQTGTGGVMPNWAASTIKGWQI